MMAMVRGHLGRWVMVLLLLGTSGVGIAREGFGRVFPDTLERGGKTLRLSGLGLREKYTFDIFVAGFYTPDGGCDPTRMIRDDDVKLLRQEFVRTVPGKRLEAEVRKVTEPRLPPDATEEDRRQAEAFIAMMRTDVREGTVLEMLYVPGQGTKVTRDGQLLGPPLPGKRFQEILWGSYLGPDSFCPKTRDQVIQSCRER